MVILDPVWNLTSMKTNRAGRTHKLLMQLPGELSSVTMPNGETSPHPLGHLQNNADETLRNIVSVLAGEDAFDFVDDFLYEMEPQSRITRWDADGEEEEEDLSAPE